MRVVFYADSRMSQFVGEDIEHVITHKMIEGGSKESLAIAVATTVKESFVRVTYILLSTSKFLTLVIEDILDVPGREIVSKKEIKKLSYFLLIK